MPSRHIRLPLIGIAALALAAPAFAQNPPPPPGTVDAEGRVYGEMPVDPRPDWAPPPPSAMPPMPPQPAASAPMGYDRPGRDEAAWQRAREDWLAECRHNHRGSGTATGAVIGGVVGGVIGNRVAGRGDRTVGTIAGAAVGAVAGGAIGAASDRHRARDWCESYLDRYTNYGGYQGYYPGHYAQGYSGYGYAYQPVMMMVPVAMVAMPAPRARECKEVVTTTEYVTYVTTKPKYRYVPKRVPDKRVKIVPDKRVRGS